MRPGYLFLLLATAIFIVSACDNDSVTGSGSGNEENGEGTEFSYDHKRGPGTSARDFLTDQNFGDLVVEIQYMEGYPPEEEAIEQLETFLQERLHKTSVTVLTPSQIPAAGQENYSASDLRDLENEYRTEVSAENRLAAYLLILDGAYEEEQVLGVAYYNTSMALFGKTIDSVSGDIGQPSRSTVEATVMLHETGHLLGLVDNGVDMQEHHRDEDNGHHCNAESCLMYYAVETADFFANLFGGNIPSLDEHCKTDLQAAGGR